MKIIFWKIEDREPWQIAAARFCVEKSEGGFSSAELKDYIRKTYKVSDRQVEFFFQEEIQRPEGRQFNRDAESGKFVPPLSLVSKITDYDELKEARKNAKQAFWISMGSVLIALVTLMVTIYTK
jgi:hypothetical protein